MFEPPSIALKTTLRDRARWTFDLSAAAMVMMEQSLRNRNPGADDETIERLFHAWMFRPPHFDRWDLPIRRLRSDETRERFPDF